MSSRQMGFGAFSRTALSVAVAIVAAAPAMAQNTTAAINGRVAGPDGKPVAGATVSIVHRESGSVSNLVTDADGRYSVRGLRVGGPYTVTVSKGADKEVREDVYLQLAESRAIDLTLGANVLATVQITGSANSKFNPTTMGAGTALGRQELDAYASLNRNLQDYARMDPRLSQTDKDRGEISAAGQNSRYNSITVDGVRINDTFGLEANGLPTIKQPISIDAIQAVQINVSNYDVTQQGYTGANINAVTKSGTNDLHGSLYYVYRDDNMAGKRYNRTTDTYTNPPPFKEDVKGLTLGGPIIKDKLFFFASYEELSSNRDVPQFGPVGSSLVNVGITPDQIKAAQDVAKNFYGIDIGGIPAADTLLVKDSLLKLDWNISDNHRANIRYTKTDQSQPIAPGFSATTLSLDSRWYTTAKTIESVVGQWFADWTDTFSTELKLSKRDYSSVPLNKSDMPEVQLVWTTTAPPGTATGNRTLRFGTEETRHFNNLQTETTNAYFAGNLLLNDHEIKAGADFESNQIYNAFVRRAKGQYTFQGTDPVALWAAGNASAYRIQQPQTGRTLDDAAANMTFDNLGLFVQDTWTVNKQLSLMAGLRIDSLSTDDRPIYNPTASTAFGYDNSHTVDGEKLIQPRFGFNYAFDIDKRKQQVRGGVGLFQGAAATVWYANPYQNTGMVVNDYECTLNNCTGANAVKYNPDPNKQPILGSSARQNVDFLAPGVSQPSVWKMNLAYDAELPWYGLSAGAEWLHTQVKQGLAYKHLNLGAPSATAPDGRQVFWNAAGQNPNCWAAGGATPANNTTPGALCSGATVRTNRNNTFNDVTLVEATDKGKGDTLTLSLTSPTKAGFGWGVAYTRTNATEVSPLTSSTAFSQWANRPVYNPNEVVAANSVYTIRNRFSANVNWSKALISKYKTSFGVFYEGRDGKPYSWTFNNDMNGDGVSGNDLLYVPKGAGSGEVLYKLPGQTVAASGAAAEAKFWSIVDSEPSLRDAKGSVVGRNTARSKFANSFDARLSQEVPGLWNNHKGVLSLDIFNVGNLINQRWGHIDEIGFSDGSGGQVRKFVNYAGIENGKMVYSVNDPFSYTTKQNKGESQWAIQVTARYEF
ncbi:TonB-dependent receptor [Roseateles violae]|uniref:TonB-dependent receptor n=1 Tax=Roseateles violae TaxID=3058042 RepID=A0ABT8DTN8_9BURK|nr:carboxypeptidase regulatory-like domain-containing protein [Pelomonas sp. PFR6]MDN3919742.1 TonB-dependent receptor [Pelomonas sp. PFR6]